ncbi:Alpha/Beta hydrolase protein [Glomus cerebriforme]|uniref:Alpha/Beta hydrolase protein n=1 Tax=Glomus cerebriforme TaxID=658196 RepID=A0A397SMA0_9GLOM|nr:Alpha/Beta hydrolase protein [Glomus cerebriforme]
MLKITNLIIPASKIRKFFGKDNAQLRLSVNCYERDIKKSNSEGITMILAHATGFHKETWEPVIKSLFGYNRLDVGKVFAFDCYNHGDSALLNEQILPDKFKWWDLAYDILQIIDYTQIKKPVVGIGHSIGGAGMVMSELIKPDTFSCIVCVDPVLSPHFLIKPAFDMNLISKRRDIWPNRETTKSLFLKNPFFKSWDSEVLELHIKYGIRELPDGQVALKCPKLQEFYTFMDDNSFSVIDAFFRLHEIECPILFLTGEKSNLNSKEWKSLIQTRTQRGEWYEVLGCSHLVTMENPKQVANGIESFVYKHLVELKDTQITPNNPSRIDQYTNFVYSGHKL